MFRLSLLALALALVVIGLPYLASSPVTGATDVHIQMLRLQAVSLSFAVVGILVTVFGLAWLNRELTRRDD